MGREEFRAAILFVGTVALVILMITAGVTGCRVMGVWEEGERAKICREGGGHWRSSPGAGVDRRGWCE